MLSIVEFTIMGKENSLQPPLRITNSSANSRAWSWIRATPPTPWSLQTMSRPNNTLWTGDTKVWTSRMCTIQIYHRMRRFDSLKIALVTAVPLSDRAKMFTAVMAQLKTSIIIVAASIMKPQPSTKASSIKRKVANIGSITRTKHLPLWRSLTCWLTTDKTKLKIQSILKMKSWLKTVSFCKRQTQEHRQSLTL